MPTSSHPEEKARRDASEATDKGQSAPPREPDTATMATSSHAEERARRGTSEAPATDKGQSPPAPLTPETAIVNRVWLVTVYSFAAAFVLSAVGVLVAPFLGVEGTDNIVKVLMLSGGFLAGILAGRGLATDVISRLLQQR